MAACDCSSVTRYRIADSFVVSFVLFPIFVCYWRGIWDLFSVYIYPDNLLYNCWVTFGIGCATIFGYAGHPLLHRRMQTVESALGRGVVTRLYMAAFGVFVMAYWKGVWVLTDYYLLHLGWRAVVGNYLLLEVLLGLLCVRQTIITSPFYVLPDIAENLLVPMTRFGVKPGLTWRYVLDAIFSNFVGVTLAIWMRRTAFRCIDYIILLLGYNEANFTFLGIGYTSALVLLSLDPVFLGVSRQIAARLDRDKASPTRRFLSLLVWERFVYFLSFWSQMFIWKCLWNLNAEYFVPSLLYGGWLNTVIGHVGFAVFQTFSYVGTCGCFVDGFLDGTTTRAFKTFYTRPMKAWCCTCQTPTSMTSLDEEQDSGEHVPWQFSKGPADLNVYGAVQSTPDSGLLSSANTSNSTLSSATNNEEDSLLN